MGPGFRSPHVVLTIALLASCKGEAPDTGEPWRPTLACPGDPAADCPDNEGALSAAAAAVTITPTCFEDWVDLDDNQRFSNSRDEFLDCGCDQLCPGDEGYPGPDAGEGDELFQASWMGGFSNGHPARSVHDELWARAVVLDQGETRLALVSVDLVGFFHDDVLRVREEIAGLDLDVDHVVVTATHTHEGPDTMGLWGRSIGNSGYDPEYLAQVRSGVVQAIGEAVAELTPVDRMVVGAVNPADAHPDGQANLTRDSRDPVVLPDQVSAAHLVDAQGDTITTLVNWGSHPETLADDNFAISSDFVHYLREAVESGTQWEGSSRGGLGGTAVYLQGMVGGMMTPLGVSIEDPDGQVWQAPTFDKARALGWLVGEMALDAVATGQVVEAPSLSFSHVTFKVPVDNIAFQAMFLIDVFERTLYDYDPAQNVSDTNLPHVLTEVGLIRLGPITMLTIPGELLPEVALGGYDGSLTGSDLYPVVDPDNPNPPDLQAAPAPPYLREQLNAEHAWILGLANDELGYIIPPYNFVTHPLNPYLAEADGDHYEETNSLGPRTEPLIVEAAQQLLTWAR